MRKLSFYCTLNILLKIMINHTHSPRFDTVKVSRENKTYLSWINCSDIRRRDVKNNRNVGENK